MNFERWFLIYAVSFFVVVFGLLLSPLWAVVVLLRVGFGGLSQKDVGKEFERLVFCGWLAQ